MRCGHRQGHGLHCMTRGRFWRGRGDLRRRLRGKLKSVGLARRDVGRGWNNDGAFYGQRRHRAMADGSFSGSSHFRLGRGRKQQRSQPALHCRLRGLGDLRNINRQHLHGMIHGHGRAGDCGGGNQIRQWHILFQGQRAWLNNSLAGADVVLIGYHYFLRSKLRIGLLRTCATRRLRLCFLGIYRRQIFRDLVMDDRLVGRRLRQYLRLVQPCQV